MPVGEGFVESGGFRFRKLSPFDQKEVVRRDVTRRREQLKRDLLDFSADKSEAIDTLREFDHENRAADTFVDAFNTVDGKADVFDLSVSDMTLPKPGCPEWKAMGNAAEMIGHVSSLAGVDKLTLACELCALTVGREPDATTTADGSDSYEDPPADPIAPAAETETTTPAKTT
jgi:hypothetical protein